MGHYDSLSLFIWLVVGHHWLLWLVVGHCGWLWVIVASCGWLWVVVGGRGSLWIIVGGRGLLWVVVGGHGSLRVLGKASYLEFYKRYGDKQLNFDFQRRFSIKFCQKYVKISFF